MGAIELYAVEERGPRPLAVAPDAAELNDAFVDLPAGVYSALRTYGGHRFLRLEEHLERTQRSADRLGWEFVLDRAALRRSLDETARAHPGDERMRFDVLPEPPRALGTDSRVVLALAPFAPVPEAYRREGVGVAVTGEVQRADPVTKASAWIVERDPYVHGTRDAYETLLLDSAGNVTEASSANLFAVAAGVLWTPDDGMLEGITRRIVLDLAHERGLPVRLAPLPRAVLAEVDELFLTSSSRHVVPVVHVEGRAVGKGRPGEVTQRLSVALDEYAEREARPA
jgi:branched-chain amino acid aminotransferase